MGSRWALGLLLLGACAGEEPAAPAGEAPADSDMPGETALVDRAAAAGIDFVHANGMVGEFHMAELIGAGAALLDYDGDGDLDAYLLQGSELEPPGADAGSGDRLFRNEYGGTGLRFIDASAGSGALGRGHGMGVATADYDNDGWIDLYRTSYGPNQLLRNRGDGSFEDRTRAAGAEDGSWSVPATFVDYDRDGWLDLFVGNYLAYSHPRAVRCAGPSGRRDYCGAIQFPGVADRLFHNRGRRGTGPVAFDDAAAEAGLTLPPEDRERALGAIAADLDGDGWQDLYVGNDAGPNSLWLSRGADAEGKVTFADGALLAGTALNAQGKAEASMGIGVADYDRDGDPDLVLGHIVVESNTLYRNRGAGLFEDRSAASELGRPSRTHTAFGMLFLDFDGDGWLDLFAANGAVQNIESLASRGDPFPVHEINQLFRNRGPIRGEVRYGEVTAVAGEVFKLSEVSRGAAGGDVDNDGDIDILLSNNNGPARLLIDSGPPRRWIGLRLVTGEPARDALGAAVTLELAAGPPRWARVATDGSYASASDPRVVFSLGAEDRVAAVKVRWPDGSRQRFAGLRSARYTTLAQLDDNRLRSQVR